VSQAPDAPHPHGRADSAGQPWAGRSFTPNPAAADDGRADPGLAAALNGFLAGTALPEDVVEAFRTARLLVPLLAHAGDLGHTAEGHLVDKTQELSIVTVEGPDGRRVLPAFTSVETLSAWNPQARPVPAAGPRIALAAASEQTQLIVIDPTSPTEFVLRRPAVYALASGEAWVPPYRDSAVRAAFEAAIAGEPAALAIDLESGDPAHRLVAEELVVSLSLRPGLTQDQLQPLIQRVTARWAASAEIANGVDSMKLRLRAAL
jgi:hypothetical protein